MFNEMFKVLYLGDDRRDRKIFAKIEKSYAPPLRFEHGKTELVAKLEPEGDGQTVEIYETRLPARFFTVVGIERHDGGYDRPAFTITTGSGDEVGALAVEIAIAAAQGMIGIKSGRKS